MNNINNSIYYICFEDSHTTRFEEESFLHAAKSFGVIDMYAIWEKLDVEKVKQDLIARLKSNMYKDEYLYLSDNEEEAKQMFDEEFEKKNLKLLSVEQEMDDIHIITTFKFSDGEELTYLYDVDELTIEGVGITISFNGGMVDKIGENRYWKLDYLRAIAKYYNNNYVREYAGYRRRDILDDINHYLRNSIKFDLFKHYEIDTDNLDEIDTTEKCYVNNITHVIIKHTDAMYYCHRRNAHDGTYVLDCFLVGDEDDVDKLLDELKFKSDYDKWKHLEKSFIYG